MPIVFWSKDFFFWEYFQQSEFSLLSCRFNNFIFRISKLPSCSKHTFVERLFKQAGEHGEQSISNRSKLLNRVNECVLTDEFSFAFVLFAFFFLLFLQFLHSLQWAFSSRWCVALANLGSVMSSYRNLMVENNLAMCGIFFLNVLEDRFHSRWKDEKGDTEK